MQKLIFFCSWFACVLIAVLWFSKQALGRDEETQLKINATTVSCDEYSNLRTGLGIFNNNVWNKHAANNDQWKQCLRKRLVEGQTQFGWSWSWPVGRRVIYAYPQVKVGSSPWAPEPKYGSEFPINISTLKELTIAHSTETTSDGDYNVATTMWLLDSAYRGSKKNASVIAAEVMIWTFSSDGHFNPAGRKRGELTIDGTTWEVWYQQKWDDKSGANHNQWISLSFRATKHSMRAVIPAAKLLRHAIEKHLIPDDLYIADIELGNEIMSGSGTTWVKEFNVGYVFVEE